MSVRAYATPTATSASTPSASTVHRARSPHFLPRERPGDAEERLPPDPREPPERTEGEGVAWACLASARVRGLRWLMGLSGTWVGGSRAGVGRGKRRTTPTASRAVFLGETESRAPGPA